MKLKDLRDVLITVGVPVYHYEAHKQDDKYIVWAEEGQGNADYADNKMISQTIEGTVDYYTKEEFDSNFDLIQETFNSAGIAWSLNSIQHEEETKYIHYEWTWEINYG